MYEMACEDESILMTTRLCLRFSGRVAHKVLSLTGSHTRSGAYGVVRAMRQIPRPYAVQSIVRRRNLFDYSSELRGELQ